MNINKSFRLDTIAAARLEEMAKNARISQTKLLEDLINACFDEWCEGYQNKNEDAPNNKGFDRLITSMRFRVDEYKE